MSDNVIVPFTGTGDATATVATDTIGGVAYQRTKVVWGADGTATDTSAAAPLPVAPISGQTTVAAGAGAVGATGQRMTLASNDPAVATLGATTDAAAGDADGTINAHVRQIAKYASLSPTVNPGNTPNTVPWLIQVQDAAGNARGANVNASNQLTVAGPVTVASGGIASGAIASGAIASGAFASGAIGSGAVASGAVASGAIASGAVASGAVASGAFVSGSVAEGAIVALGSTTGAAVVTDATGTVQQYLRGLVKMAGTAGSFLVTAALSAGSNLIGYVGFKSTYAGKVSLTTTSFDTLADGSGWQSVGIATGGARDLHFFFKTQTTGTAFINVYVAGKLSNGTGYADAATGTEGTFTAANRLNSRFLGALRMNNASSSGFFALSDIFGAAIPANVAFIIINNAGAAITTATTTMEYEFVN